MRVRVCLGPVKNTLTRTCGTPGRNRTDTTFVTGLIDSDYQGPLTIALMNRNKDKSVIITPMLKVMQLVIVPVVRPKFEFVTEYGTNTVRGSNGYGSTGTH